VDKPKVQSGILTKEELFMKPVFMYAGVLLAAASLLPAQSPAAAESKTIGGKNVSIKYASPRVNGRVGKLFGKDGRIAEDPNYPVWRAGANAATMLHTDADLNVGGVNVPKGDYTLYVDLTDPDKWLLIVNKQTGQSGLSYDKAQDVGRARMTMSKPPAPIENLKYTLADEGGNKGKLTLEWENHIASVPITVK
jgi:hypothetical protein